MSKFTIYSASGTALYTGTPTYTGSYRKPGMIEFRNVSVPEYIDFAPGCYIGWQTGSTVHEGYSRTGLKYKIYTVPQVKKQARSGSYGAAFVYQSVQLFDASKDLEYCPFRDLVKGDNRIHFSTQPSISTFESVSGGSGEAGLAARFQACLEDMYGAGSWVVRTATAADGASAELLELMADAREFTVSGVNLLEALDKVFDIWPEVGWIYKVENNKNTIVIGGAGLNDNQGNYMYGKGNGLTALTRTVANADELANRIFAYGSQRNMSSDWYRSQSIKDNESVDIQHLMIPTTYWGTTGNRPDAAKAYVEDAASVARLGLRPRSAYFDGTEDLPEIYPTIEGMTISDVLAASPDYIPNTTTIWRDPTHTRVDELHDADAFDDDGYSGSSGLSRLASIQISSVQTAYGTSIPSNQEEWSFAFFTRDLDGPGFKIEIEAALKASGTLTVEKASRVYTHLMITKPNPVSGESPIVLAEAEFDAAETFEGSGVWNLVGGKVDLGGTYFSLGQQITVVAYACASLDPLDPVDVSDPGDEEQELVVPESRSVVVNTTVDNGQIYETVYREKTFHVTLRQVGFDIAAQGDLGDGKVISMRSGNCQGRSFAIKDAVLDTSTDTWDLECYRSEDESLGQWFPNSIYPVEEGDRFVLLDIAMPDSYVTVAENRLYQAAQELLADTATERWQYTPEIDAKFMIENNWTIRPAEYMNIVGVDIVDGAENFVYLDDSTGANLQTTAGENLILDGSGYLVTALVDTVVISEGDAAIPTYKVTLLDRKRKVFTDSKSVSEYTAKSVANAKQVETSKIASESAFFELCDDGSVKLKDKFTGLWAQGFVAAGGVAAEGEGGSGGGSGIGTNVQWGTKVSGYSRVLTVAGESETVLLDGALSSLTRSYNSLFTTVNSLSNDIDTLEAGFSTLQQSMTYLTAIVNAIDWFTVVTVSGQTTLRLNPRYVGLWANGWISAGGTGSGGSGGGGGGVSTLEELTDVSISSPHANGDLLVYNSATLKWENKPQSSIVTDLTSVNSRLTTIEGQITTIFSRLDAIDWFTVVTVDDSLTVKLNSTKYVGLWADGWISAGGVGSSGSGGGGGSSTLAGLTDVSISSVSNGDLLTYDTSVNSGTWVPVTRASLLSGLLTQSTADGRYLSLSGGTLTGTVQASGWSITTSGNAKFYNVLGDGSHNLYIGNDSNTRYVWIQEDTYVANVELKGGTSTSDASSPTWLINGSGAANFASVSVTGGTSSGFLKANGTVDTSTYLSSHQSIYGLTLSAGSFTGGTYTPNSAAGSFNVPTTLDHITDGTNRKLSDYVTLTTTQTISGTKTFSSTNTTTKNILPFDTATFSLGSSSARWNELYSVDGYFSGDLTVNGDVTINGDLTLDTASYIAIGPVKISYDSTNKALRVWGTYTESNETKNIGLYCDGWVAAGGIQPTS